jgi:hypothetical protein
VYENVNRQVYVYPTLAAGATVVSANADWTYGAYATVVPASTILSDYHFFGNAVYVIGSAHIAANARVRARLASSNGAAAVATSTISISYVQHA